MAYDFLHLTLGLARMALLTFFSLYHRMLALQTSTLLQEKL